MKTQLLSPFHMIWLGIKSIAYHLFPFRYEDVTQFVLAAKKGSFAVTMKEKFVPDNDENFDNSFSSPLSFCGGIMYFHLKGSGNGRKRDIVCDIPIGYSSLQCDDIKHFLEAENKKKEEIMKICDFFVVPIVDQEV